MGKPVPMYAGPMHDAAASGDLATMKKVAAEAEAYLSQSGDVSAALEALRKEIAKLERGGC